MVPNSIILNNMIVYQSNNEYEVCTPQYIYTGHLYLPPNGLYIADAKTLNIITKVLAVRWGVIGNKK